MIPPANHLLIITDRHGTTVRGTVVHLLRIMADKFVVHIMTSDRLDSYQYEAVYIADSQVVKGFSMLFAYESAL